MINEKYFINYDSDHDVLRILKSSDKVMIFDEEVSPGIYFTMSDDEKECLAITILDFKKRKKEDLQILVSDHFEKELIETAYREYVLTS